MVHLSWPANIALVLLTINKHFTEGYRRTTAISVQNRQASNSSTPSWAWPNAIQQQPDCMSTSPTEDCPYRESTAISACSSEQCTTRFIGACMETAILVDKGCLCNKLNDQGCSACNGTRLRSEYLYWLNSTCSAVDGWNGLSLSWEDQIPALNLVWIGNWTAKPWFKGCHYGSVPCDDSYFPGFDPLVLQNSCTGFSSLWGSNIYNSTEAATMTFRTPEKNYSPWFTANPLWYDPKYDYGIYLDLDQFCQSAYPASELNCGADVLHSQVVLWASNVCNPPSSFGWPENWKDSVLIIDSNFVEDSTWPPLPTLPTHQSCSEHVFIVTRSCLSQRCKGPTCDRIVTAISSSCFCKEMDISSKCHPDDVERTSLFIWLDQRCKSVAEFPRLPDEWEDTLLVMNSTSYGSPSNFTTWPKCANANGCGTTLNDTVTNCAQTLCHIDPKTKLCDSTTFGVKPECYCSPSKSQGCVHILLVAEHLWTLAIRGLNRQAKKHSQAAGHLATQLMRPPNFPTDKFESSGLVNRWPDLEQDLATDFRGFQT